MLTMLEQIARQLGPRSARARRKRALAQTTQPEALSEQIDRATESSEQAAPEAP